MNGDLVLIDLQQRLAFHLFESAAVLCSGTQFHRVTIHTFEWVFNR